MMPRVRRQLGAALAAVLVMSACGGADKAAEDPAVSHSCVEKAEGASIPWDRLRNPIFTLPDAAAKDVAVRLVDGRWRLLFSHVREDPFRFRIGITSSPDLLAWSPVELWDQPELGGVASPDVTRESAGDFLVTYNSHTRDTEGEDKLYIRRSRDFVSWSEPARLAFEVRPQPDDRLIDAALAHTSSGLFLGYNYEEDHFEMARSTAGSPDGPWERIGEADTGPLENYQFFQIDGVWHLLGTAIPVHRELLYRLAGPPDRPESWLHWELVRELAVPSEEWNRWPGEVANAAYLCDARSLDGHWYLFYAGSTELDRFGGVITGCTVAISQTGTLILQDVPGQGRRAPTLVPDYHLCVVRGEDVVETVPEAMRRLQRTATLATTFVSGPSATADIEMTRIKGVHGPRFLDVVLVV